MARATGKYFGFNTTQADTLERVVSEGGTVTGASFEAAGTTSAQLKAALSDETGSGANVFATSPTLVTPALGTPSALVLTNATGLPGSAVLNTTPTAYATDGAVGPTVKIAVLSKGSAGAYTLAAGADGAHLYITSTTAFAHVVTATSLINDGVTGAPHSTMTFAAFPGATIHLVSYNSKWQVVAKNAVTVS